MQRHRFPYDPDTYGPGGLEVGLYDGDAYLLVEDDGKVLEMDFLDQNEVLAVAAALIEIAREMN